MSKRNAQALSRVDEDRADGLSQMDVLMGVEVAGLSTHQAVKNVQLVGDLLLNGRDVL